MKTIGLCMIVKNESRVILRCLESVRPLIDYVLIEDTGSSDGTQDIIRSYLEREDLPGEVLDEPWHDFAHNRSVALARLRERPEVDYALIIDADDVLVCEEGFDAASFKAGMTADLYSVAIRDGSVRYHRPQICNNRLEFRYRGVVHEFLQGPDKHSGVTARGFYINRFVEGARSEDPDKYRKDARAIEKALETEGDPGLRSRYVFYLAQSWRDAGENEKALAAYLQCAELGRWKEEVFVSLYNAARLKERLGHPASEVIGMYLRAFETCPHRAEALHGAARYCRVTRNFHQGHMVARQGVEVPEPAGGLFMEPWIYQYGLLDELAVNAYWAGRYEECLNACERMLREGFVPEPTRARIEGNARFARQMLTIADGRAAKPGAPVMLGVEGESWVHRDATDEERREPIVLMAILAKQKERVLPFYLTCIDALDYPKDRIVLYVRTNNNRDQTAEILRSWLGRVRHQYAHVEFDDSDVAEPVQEFGVHEWNATRFKVLAQIRQASLQFAWDRGCDFYFVVDTDNFLKPHTLRSLVAANLPIVAPLLRHEDGRRFYSNYHEKIDAHGYYLDSEEYLWLLFQRVKGLNEVPVVHCTYLVRRDAIPRLSYDDGSGRHEYVIFSDSARKNNVAQYLDNRDVYGWLTLDEEVGQAPKWLGAPLVMAARRADISATRVKARSQDSSGAAQPIFVHSSWRTGSTWFWSKFRQLPSTLAFYEPFAMLLNTVVRTDAVQFDSRSWASGHFDTDPYCLEYVPLIRGSGGVRLFSEPIPYEWFIPEGGLAGKLRPVEQRYLGFLLREAEIRGRTPILGFCRSLGRISAIKRAFGGLNIFLIRNLWSQWTSYVEFRRRGEPFFYETVPLLVNRRDDPFLAALGRHYVECGGGARGHFCAHDLVGTEEGYRVLSSLAEPDAFGMFMGLQLYLYLHAMLAADVVVESTRMAKDAGYRSDIEHCLRDRAGLNLSFADAREPRRRAFMFEVEAIDWDGIRKHARAAVQALGGIAEAGASIEAAEQWIADAAAEARAQSEAADILHHDGGDDGSPPAVEVSVTPGARPPAGGVSPALARAE